MTEHEHPSKRNPEQVSSGEERRPGESPRADPTNENRASKTPRPDTTVRGVMPDARHAMEESDDTFDETGFAKGENHPTVHQTRIAHDVEANREMLDRSPRPIFPDSPGGSTGALPLAEERHDFLDQMVQMGHFDSVGEAKTWARAVFDALRERANDVDNMRATVFDEAVRLAEDPSVQVETMMWGEGFPERIAWLVSKLEGWSKQDFERRVASYANTTPDDPWVEAAIYSYLGALKRTLGGKSDQIGNLGEMQEIWDRS